MSRWPAVCSPSRCRWPKLCCLARRRERSEIVGVTRDVKSAGVYVADAGRSLPFRYPQPPRQGLNVVAKRPAIRRLAGRHPHRRMPPSTERRRSRSSQRWIRASRLSLGYAALRRNIDGSLCALALVLSLTGLYSVLAYLVSQRTPEIGIRMALGASRHDVIALVMRSGLGLVVIGLVLGMAGAAAAGRLLRQQLFGVEAVSVGIYIGVAVLFALVATVACLVPSLRASRIDPQAALRIG